MSRFYTGSPVSDRKKLVRLGLELRQRKCFVGEHPLFGGVAPVHMKGSKHNTGDALDINKSWVTWGKEQASEDAFFDILAPELMARGFGVIWNRGSGDHDKHLHVETIRWKSENYNGRTRLKTRNKPWTANLVVDGKRGPKTISALQTAMGTYVDGKMDWGGSLGKSLQAFLNTELNAGLVVDGKCGRLTQRALSEYFGFGKTNHSYITQGQWRVIQERLNKHGHIARA